MREYLSAFGEAGGPGRERAQVDTGILYCNDNLERLAELPSDSVDLVYLDPPFFSNRVYQVIWGDEAEVRSFEDRWEGGIQHYIGWMRERVQQLHRVLKPTGSLYLHCDPHASHYLKVMLDQVFGLQHFVNEIIWKRSSAHSDTGQGAKHYGRLTDTIFFYSKSGERTWNQQYTSYDEAYVERDYRRVEPETGRRYRLSDMSGPGGAAKGNPYYEVLGVSRHWRFTQEKMDALLAEGRVIQTRPGAVPQYKRYLDEMPGVALQNLWTDVPVINNRSRERLGYPTQKPEALLERILLASSNPGDVVLDPFCGCGTTIAVAQRLDRQWVGIDISTTAMEVMRRRLWNQSRTVPTIVDMPTTEEDLRQLKPFEFQNWVINAVNGSHTASKVHDMGIDGYWWFTKDPIQVKQTPTVGREVVDTFETAMRRAGNDTGYIIGFRFSKGAVDEVARARSEGLHISLLSVKEVLMQVRRTQTSKKFGPQPEGELIPLPTMRKSNELPSVEQLIASDREAALA